MRNKKYDLSNFMDGHFFSEFQGEPDFYYQKYIGGLLIFIQGKRVVWLCEKPGIKRWRKRIFKKDIWNGCLIASLNYCHEPLIKILPGSHLHPVIRDSIYLARDSEYFEESMLKLVDLIRNKSPLIGVEHNF